MSVPGVQHNTASFWSWHRRSGLWELVFKDCEDDYVWALANGARKCNLCRLHNISSSHPLLLHQLVWWGNWDLKRPCTFKWKVTPAWKLTADRVLARGLYTAASPTKSSEPRGPEMGASHWPIRRFRQWLTGGIRFFLPRKMQRLSSTLVLIVICQLENMPRKPEYLNLASLDYKVVQLITLSWEIFHKPEQSS